MHQETAAGRTWRAAQPYLSRLLPVVPIEAHDFKLRTLDRSREGSRPFQSGRVRQIASSSTIVPALLAQEFGDGNANPFFRDRPTGVADRDAGRDGKLAKQSELPGEPRFDLLGIENAHTPWLRRRTQFNRC